MKMKKSPRVSGAESSRTEGKGSEAVGSVTIRLLGVEDVKQKKGRFFWKTEGHRRELRGVFHTFLFRKEDASFCLELWRTTTFGQGEMLGQGQVRILRGALMREEQLRVQLAGKKKNKPGGTLLLLLDVVWNSTARPLPMFLSSGDKFALVTEDKAWSVSLTGNSVSHELMLHLARRLEWPAPRLRLDASGNFSSWLLVELPGTKALNMMEMGESLVDVRHIRNKVKRWRRLSNPLADIVAAMISIGLRQRGAHHWELDPDRVVSPHDSNIKVFLLNVSHRHLNLSGRVPINVVNHFEKMGHSLEELPDPSGYGRIVYNCSFDDDASGTILVSKQAHKYAVTLVQFVRSTGMWSVIPCPSSAGTAYMELPSANKNIICLSNTGHYGVGSSVNPIFTNMEPDLVIQLLKQLQLTRIHMSSEQHPVYGVDRIMKLSDSEEWKRVEGLSSERRVFKDNISLACADIASQRFNLDVDTRFCRRTQLRFLVVSEPRPAEHVLVSLILKPSDTQITVHGNYSQEELIIISDDKMLPFPQRQQEHQCSFNVKYGDVLLKQRDAIGADVMSSLTDGSDHDDALTKKVKQASSSCRETLALVLNALAEMGFEPVLTISQMNYADAGLHASLLFDRSDNSKEQEEEKIIAAEGGSFLDRSEDDEFVAFHAILRKPLWRPRPVRRVLQLYASNNSVEINGPIGKKEGKEVGKKLDAQEVHCSSKIERVTIYLAENQEIGVGSTPMLLANRNLMSVAAALQTLGFQQACDSANPLSMLMAELIPRPAGDE